VHRLPGKLSVSPKAIYVREEFQVVRDGARTITPSPRTAELDGAALRPGRWARRLFCPAGKRRNERRLIADNSGQDVKLAGPWTAAPAATAGFSLKCAAKPYIDLALCTGCGVCEQSAR